MCPAKKKAPAPDAGSTDDEMPLEAESMEVEGGELKAEKEAGGTRVTQAKEAEPLEAESPDEEALEAEPVDEAKSAPVPEDRAGKGSLAVGALATAPRPGERSETETTMRRGAIAIVILLLLIFAGVGISNILEDDDDDALTPPDAEGFALRWREPVWLPRDPDCIDDNGQVYPEYAIGYEPSIAVDAEGNMFYTAHKDLRWAGPNGGPGGFESGVGSMGPYACRQPVLPPYSSEDRDTSWDYYASWFFVTNDGGETWAMPPWGSGTDPSSGQPHASMLYGGDEGDIGIDANQRVYFLDTYLLDNWIHRWDDGGREYIDYTSTQGSEALDDRPWLTAQGDGIVHYLGNSATAIPDCFGGSGRYWYYRSDDGGYTFTQCYAMPGGWSHIDAERDGQHVYVVQEENDGASGDIQVRVSDDTGLTWADAQIIAPRESNPPEGFPWISAGPASTEGLVATVWADAYGGRTGPWSMGIAMSWDYGVTWEHWDLTPFKGIFEYPNVYVGPNNTVAVAFYGLEGDYVAGNEWHLYAGMVQDPEPGTPFQFTVADPHPLHTVTEYEETNNDVHALHDLFEIAIDPNDLSLNIAYQYNIGEHPFEANEEQRYLMFVKGDRAEGLGLSSPSFREGGDIPAKHTIDGSDSSPALVWSEPPEGTVSLAVMAVDLDSGQRPFTHWLIWNISAKRSSLPGGIATREVVLGDARQGTNNYGFVGYGGPDPPEGENHTYRFTVFALDAYLDLEPGAKRVDLHKAMAGHVLSMGTLTGEYRG